MPCKDPYFLIEGAVECLARGDHKGADTLLNDASESVGRYFSPGSGKDRDLEQAIEFIRYILHNYPDEFMTDKD